MHSSKITWRNRGGHDKGNFKKKTDTAGKKIISRSVRIERKKKKTLLIVEQQRKISVGLLLVVLALRGMQRFSFRA